MTSSWGFFSCGSVVHRNDRFFSTGYRVPGYNTGMTDFGTGPTLRATSAWLQDDAERQRRILDVVERDSVIEGLPPFQAETRANILRQLQAMNSGPAATPPQPS